MEDIQTLFAQWLDLPFDPLEADITELHDDDLNNQYSAMSTAPVAVPSISAAAPDDPLPFESAIPVVSLPAHGNKPRYPSLPKCLLTRKRRLLKPISRGNNLEGQKGKLRCLRCRTQRQKVGSTIRYHLADLVHFP